MADIGVENIEGSGDNAESLGSKNGIVDHHNLLEVNSVVENSMTHSSEVHDGHGFVNEMADNEGDGSLLQDKEIDTIQYASGDYDAEQVKTAVAMGLADEQPKITESTISFDGTSTDLLETVNGTLVNELVETVSIVDENGATIKAKLIRTIDENGQIVTQLASETELDEATKQATLEALSSQLKTNGVPVAMEPQLAEDNVKYETMQALQQPVVAEAVADMHAEKAEPPVNTETRKAQNPNQIAIQSQTEESNKVKVDPNAPLGSSLNPIRIVQHGNKYTSMQQLNQEQLAQIMQVLQQQQLTSSVSPGGGSSGGGATTQGGSSVIYNPETQTRIVYKVLSSKQRNSMGRGRASLLMATPDGVKPKRGPGRPPKRKKPDDEDRPPLDTPEMSREEKEERKKMRLKTRSGRVSKPPKHMMKDYKHLHRVNWDEDFREDDSDVGFEDIKAHESDDESPGKRMRKNEDADFTPVGVTEKEKLYECKVCDKAYISRARLERHFIIVPSHRTEVEPVTEAEETEDEGGEMDEERAAKLAARAQAARERLIERRRYKLKEAARVCSNEELMEIVLPRLAKTVTPFEFLLLRAERGKEIKRPDAKFLMKNFEELLTSMRGWCKKRLQKGVGPGPNAELLEISEPRVAVALDLEVDTYTALQPEVQAAATIIPFVKADGSKAVQPIVQPQDELILSATTGQIFRVVNSRAQPVAGAMVTAPTLRSSASDTILTDTGKDGLSTQQMQSILTSNMISYAAEPTAVQQQASLPDSTTATDTTNGDEHDVMVQLQHDSKDDGAQSLLTATSPSNATDEEAPGRQVQIMLEDGDELVSFEDRIFIKRSNGELEPIDTTLGGAVGGGGGVEEQNGDVDRKEVEAQNETEKVEFEAKDQASLSMDQQQPEHVDGHVAQGHSIEAEKIQPDFTALDKSLPMTQADVTSAAEEEQTVAPVATTQQISEGNVFQTEDGLFLLENADGTYTVLGTAET